MKTNSNVGHQQTIDSGDTDQVDQLLGEVAEEYFQRVSRGEEPSIEEYATRYPQIADLIRETFAAVTFINQSAVSEIHSGSAAKPTTSVREPSTVGDFRIVREIGRGGMGVVYEAEQLSLGRPVALKVLPYAAMLDQKAITRFKNEARAAATLDHPNIVPIHAVGNERGIYYYAMSLIDGVTLAELIQHLQRSFTDENSSKEKLSIEDYICLSPADDTPARGSEPTVDLSAKTNHDTGQLGWRNADTYREVAAALLTHQSRFSVPFFRSLASLGARTADALHHLSLIHI